MRFPDHLGRVFVYGHPVDMRKGFNGLQALVQHQLGEDPLGGDLFVFLNRLRTFAKCLFWDRTGFVIVYKRLERGRFQLRTSLGKVEIDTRCLELLLDGIPVGGIARDS